MDAHKIRRAIELELIALLKGQGVDVHRHQGYAYAPVVVVPGCGSPHACEAAIISDTLDPIRGHIGCEDCGVHTPLKPQRISLNVTDMAERLALVWQETQGKASPLARGVAREAAD